MPEITTEVAVDACSADRTMGTYRRAAPLFESGEGAWITDADGRRYLDWISGIGATSLGHAHPALSRAIADQAQTLGHVSNLYRHAVGEELSQRLCERTGMDAVFFSNSGSEANEAALKLARKWQAQRGQPGRQRFVALRGGFHGRTFGSLSVTANPAYREPFGEGLGATFVEPGDSQALSAALHDEPCALILEPIQGEGGLKVVCDGFLRTARELCSATGTVLIHDEIQSGGGRTGTYLASQACAADVAPDIVTLAKPIGAGMPIGATLARGDFARTLVPGDHGSTFGGGPLACRAALVVLDELDHGLQARVAQLGAAMEARADQLVARHDVLVARRGRGLMQGLVAPGRAGDIVAALLEHGLLACPATADVVRFLPPYILTDDELDHGFDVLDRVLATIDSPSAPLGAAKTLSS